MKKLLLLLSFYCCCSIIADAATTTLNLRLYLKSYYSTNGMMAANPTGNPPNGANEVDYITVELRENTAPYNNIVATFPSAILKTNGNLNSCTFNNLPTAFYWIVVKNRRAVETWSKEAVNFPSGTTVTYDFSGTSAGPWSDESYDSNQKSVANGRYAIWDGDLNQDGAVDIKDYDLIKADALAAAFGDFVTDLNLDLSVDALDMALWEVIAKQKIGKKRPK